MVDFAVISLLVALSPGPSWLYVMTRTAQHGQRGAVRAILGNATGILVHLGAVIVGAATLLEMSQQAFRLLALAGAGYLIWLGLKMILDRDRTLPTSPAINSDISAPDSHAPDSHAPESDCPDSEGSDSEGSDSDGSDRTFREGVLMATLNPKISLLMLALLPQYVALDAARPALEMAALGMVHVAIASTTLSLVATSVLASRRRLERASHFGSASRLRSALRWGSGLVMIAFGIRLAFGR